MNYLKLLIFVLVFLNFQIGVSQNNPYIKPKNGYVNVEGGKIWYGIMGEGDKTPLLCLHGGPGGSSHGFFNLSEIAKERPVIMFDQLGAGRSDHHQDTSLLKVEKFVEQVRAVKNELKLDEFYLVGSSWGTALALEYYTKYPDGVKGIIFNSPYFSTETWTKDARILISKLPDSIQQDIYKAEKDSVFDSQAYAEANIFYLRKHGRRNKYTPHPDDTLQYERTSFVYNYMWGPSEFTAAGTLKNYDNNASLSKIKVPTLFTTGEFDEARPETIKKYSESISNSTFVVIPNSGHFSLNDNKPFIIKAMKKFILRSE